MIKLSIKERREQFLFFLGIFLFVSALLCTALFYDYGEKDDTSKSQLIGIVKDEKLFEETVEEKRPIVDTTYKQIIKSNPNVQALFLENDIKNAINSLKTVYEQKAADSRYKTFIQASQLYYSLFFNKRELRGNYTDIEKLTKALEDCKLSRQHLEQSLNSKSK